MHRSALTGAALALVATAALAHQGVQNAAVQARMHGMSVISDNVKVLGTMAKGQRAFDAATAQAAAHAIAEHADASVALFRPKETDPKSEALDVIWDQFDDFEAKANALESLARDLAVSMTSVDDVQGAVAQLGVACKVCHAIYRE